MVNMGGNDSDRDPFIGRVLENKYVLEQVLGRGGMGSVFSARRRQIGDLVAIKVLRIDDNLDPIDLKRFQLEAATAASIKHQNIISIHDFGLLEDIAYLVMERLEGPALSDEICAHGTIPLERAVTIFKQVCAAVTAAHKQGVIHRDLKPSNIIFQLPGCVDDLIKVVDFGLAKLIRSTRDEKLTGANIAIGTPEYMSPEQAMGYRLDERSDIYALGVVLYEMLTGKVPFHTPVVSAILIQHAIEPPRPPSRLNQALAPEIDAVILKSLEKEPEKRYQSAIEMAVEFEMACRSIYLSRRSAHVPQTEEASSLQTEQSPEKTRTVSPSRRAPLPFNPGAPTRVFNLPRKESEPFRFSFERFVGRGEELKRLGERFEQARAGFGRVTFIIGDPGSGKTELAKQFRRGLDPETALFFSARFYEFSGDNSPFRAYLDLLFSFTRNFLKWSTGKWPKAVEELPAKIRPLLDDIDSLISLEKMEGLSAKEQSKYRAFELLTEIFSMMSAEVPIILFLDDLHWADSLSLEFLAYLARNTEKDRIFVLCTLRSQELLDDTLSIKTWLRTIGLYSNYDQIRLSLLSETDVKSLIHSIFGNIVISERVIERLYETTQGNPLYLGEILRQLIQEQKIVWSDERWQCADLEGLDLPCSILDLVELHLRRLNVDMLDVFTRAAVVGQKFSFNLLSKITDVQGEALLNIIDAGLSEFIIKESTAADSSASDHYAFYHSTLRKALYDRLSAPRRRQLHAEIGEKLEKLTRRRRERVASELAYHFYHGAYLKDHHLKALRYSVDAGNTARSVFAIEEVSKYYSWADKSLELLSESGEEIEYRPEWQANFRLSYGTVLTYMGRNDLAQEQLDMGLELTEETALSSLRGKIMMALGELCWSRGRYKESLEFCEKGLKLLTLADDIGGQCRIFCVIGNACFSQGRHDQAILFYNKSLELSHQGEDLSSKGEALRNIALIMARQGKAEQSLKKLDEALAIASQTNDRESERQIQMLIGNIYYEQGELDLARNHYNKSRTIARPIGRRRGECRVLLNMGEICRQQGDLYEARDLFNEAQKIATEIEDRETEAHTFSNLGLVYQGLEDLERAMDCFEQALKIFRETEYRSDAEVEALSGIANILWQQDRVAEAKEYYISAINSGRELCLWNLVVSGLRCLATCERALGQFDTARKHLHEALSTLENLTSSQSDQIRTELNQEIASF